MADNIAEQVLNMTTAQLDRMKKDDLITLLTDTAKQWEQLNKKTDVLVEINERMKKLGTLEAKLEKLDTLPDALDEIKASVSAVANKVTEIGTTLTDHSAELDVLRPLPARVDTLNDLCENNFADIYKSMEYLQRFAEGLDSRQRGKNIIILGVSESSDALGDDDTTRIKNIIEKTSAMTLEEIGDTSVKRLGERIIAGRPRPILVCLEDHAKQWKILQNAKNLKDITGYSNIYIKRDIHPTVSREQNRLRKREKELKEDPANRGVNIIYDYKNRVLKRDGVMIDRFNPHF